MGEQRHLAIFIRSLQGGGAERMMVTLAGAFAEAGHRVDLVLGRGGGAFFDDIPDAVRVVDLGGGSIARSLAWLARKPATAALLAPALFVSQPPWILLCIPALADWLRRERPDAMLSALNYTNITAILGRRLAGVDTRLVLSERNVLSVRAERGGQGRLRALPSLVRKLYPEADAVGAVSSGVADDLARVTGIPRDSIRVTHNPVATPDIAQRAAEPLDHPWFAPGEPPVVLGAGKLKPQKGFATLLQAFAELRARRPARLVILGDGPERQALEARARELEIADDVAMPGFQDNPFAWMGRAAVFALSSEWEGLPGVLIQALACGCPVVSTDCPSGPAEILEEGAWGPLVAVGDSAALASAIEGVLDRPPDPDELRARAQAFSVQNSTAEYLEMLLP